MPNMQYILRGIFIYIYLQILQTLEMWALIVISWWLKTRQKSHHQKLAAHSFHLLGGKKHRNQQVRPKRNPQIGTSLEISQIRAFPKCTRVRVL